MRYAVYVVVVEDSSDADMRLSESVESLERLTGDLSFREAEDEMGDIAQVEHEINRFLPYGSWDE